MSEAEGHKYFAQRQQESPRGGAAEAAFMLGIVAEVLGLKPSDAAVQRAVLFTVLPCIAMMIAPRQMQTAVLPSASTDSDAIAGDYVRFVMAGLEAIAVADRSEKSAPQLTAWTRKG